MLATPAESRNQAPLPLKTSRALSGRRADPPRAPRATPAVLKARAERTLYLRGREQTQARSIQRGLLLLALLAFIISLVRAGTARAFFPGWWQHW